MSHVGMGTQWEFERIGRAGYAYPPKPCGTVFWVDSGWEYPGNDDHDGLTKDSPLRTITEALSRCTDNMDDVILVKDAWQEATETWPILVDKKRVHIIGISGPQGQKVKMVPPPLGDTAAFDIRAAANTSEIAGFELGGGDTHGCIELANPMGVWIHDIWFGNALHLAGTTPLHGIYNPTGLNASSCRIERCRFFGSSGPGQGGISGNGIEDFATGAGAGGTFRNSEIVNNRFTCLAFAIHMLKPGDAVIEHNYIMCPADDVVGRGIYLQTATGCMMANNKAGFGVIDMTQNPYYDHEGTSNAWLCNQNGDSMTQPAHG